MGDFRSQRMRGNEGYSLVELLAVTMILLILSLFAVPLYQTLTDKARLATSAEDLRVIEGALEAYYATNGQYPDRLWPLAKEGYLRNDSTFRSPWSNGRKVRYYFYAVDNLGAPHAFILGDPGPQPICNQNSPATLYASKLELLPCGTNPKDDPARVFAGDTPQILLIPPPAVPPGTLSGFRQLCNPTRERSMRIAPGCVVKTES